ncbi:HNH endonuclease [Vibrio cholerae]|uniref:HNH endonuclease n=1 Tax=Vibrio cholerae TaxID=666 RepID=UPI0018F0D08B|nr:HNH endonuclease [Vibrio cholerae]MBJ6934211.1 HNH endonuclease [Vibrio cholerae]
MSSIYDELIATGQWGDREIRLCIEFDFKCAYCKKDMLKSVENYKEWQTDHIVPYSKSGDDSYDNCVLSCRTCNFIKGTWNPLSVLNGEPVSRDKLIQLSQNYVLEKRECIESQIHEYRRITQKHS